VVQHDTEGMIEEYIQGDELTCAVLGQKPGEEPMALPPTMIVPRTSRFFDYEAKYTPGASREITPAPISAKLTRQVQQIAVKAHQILGCGSMSRTDILLRKGKCYLLETNTIPGMTATSLYPQAAISAGIDLPQLFDHVILMARMYHHAKKSKL
jgi:D-alanine-D-alanine ligase